MDYDNKPEGYYSNDRPEMFKYLPKNPSKILDVGCGDGSFGRELKDKTQAEIWGIEYREEEAIKAEKVLDKVFTGPCEKNIEELPDDFFDVIYFNDVLEHLIDPYTVLENIKPKFREGGVVISSIPNIRYFKAMIKFVLEKDWKYQSYGVMDKTHYRFFTGKSIKRMYEEQGYEILQHEGINGSSSIRPWLYNIPFLFTHLDVRYLQYATVARPK